MNPDLVTRLTEELSSYTMSETTSEAVKLHRLPNREFVRQVCDLFLSILFPGFYNAIQVGRADLSSYIRKNIYEIDCILCEQICLARRYNCSSSGDALPDDLVEDTRNLVKSFFERLPEVGRLIHTDVEAAFNNDPAACNHEEIILSYPCIEAISIYRLAHELYKLDVPLIPRIMTEIAHSHTGIDIHPGAQIDESFFIDHGTGVVIGETCEIGKHCVLYHGVTLGAFNPLWRNEEGELPRGQSNKRHPSLEEHVVVYPGATILGGDTLIGAYSVIGGNVWLTHSVDTHSVVTMEDPKLNVKTRSKKK